MAGANNKATIGAGAGNYIIGYNNEQRDTGPSFIFGMNNKKVAGAIVIGYDNGTSAWGQFGSSYQNLVIGYNARSTCREGIVLGNNLAGNGYAIGTTILGICNKKDNQDYGLTEKIDRSSSAVIVGAGTSNNRLNAIEVNNTGLVAIPHGLCLDSTTTTVNAITPPQDPNNVTQDDMTLVTKSYVNSLVIGVKTQLSYFEDWDTAPALPLDNTPVDLAQTYGAIPAWANRVILTLRWENELFTKEVFLNKNEGIHLHMFQREYSTFPERIEVEHLRIEWNSTAMNLQVADYWVYNQDMANGGTISGWDHTLANAPVCKILSVVYSE